MIRGDFVTLRLGDQEIEAMVTLASPNGRSLVLMFDGMLRTPDGGGFPGVLAVFQEDDGSWVEIVRATRVEITLRKGH